MTLTCWLDCRGATLSEKQAEALYGAITGFLIQLTQIPDHGRQALSGRGFLLIGEIRHASISTLPAKPAPSSAPHYGDFESVGEQIDSALEAPERHFAKLLRRVEGRNYGSLDANQQIALIIQDIADRLRLAFICPKCDRPARFRCSEAPTSKTGMFVFSHGRQTHGGKTILPALELTAAPPDRRKISAKSTA